MPRSPIFGLISSSSKTLLAFGSLWMIFSLESWWTTGISLLLFVHV
jgi:hypothetical protein